MDKSVEQNDMFNWHNILYVILSESSIGTILSFSRTKQQSFQFTHKMIIAINYCCCIYYIISPPTIYIRLLRLLYYRLSAECPSQTLEKNKVFIISTWPCMATMDRCLFYEILWINPPTPLQTIIFTKIIPLSIFYAQGVLGSVRAVWSHRAPQIRTPIKI